MSRKRVGFLSNPMGVARLFILAVCFLCFFSTPGWSIVNRVVESFNTTTYKDAVNTTADWNTSLGRLQFPPFQPTLLGTFDTGLALDVVVAGRLAYVADEAAGVVVVNVSTPSSPFLSGSYDTPGLARGLTLSGTTLFVADDVAGLLILNAQFSGNPTFMGSFNTAGTAHDVAVSGTTAFVADGANGLVILDINSPGTPTLLATFPTSDTATGVEVRGTTAYLAAGTAGLLMVNVSNPASPTLLGSFDTSGSAQGVDVSGKYAYVADRASGVVIIDVSNPGNPSSVGSYDTPGDAWSVTVSGTEAYVGDQSAGLHVLDVQNPAAPSLWLTLDTAGNASGLAVAGGLAFVADGSPGLRVVSVRSPMAPAEAGFADTPDYARRIAVVGTIVYVADDDASGLQLIDISNPSAPVVVGSYNTPGTAYDVFVSGTRAYVADGPAGLVILDVSNPASPQFLGSFDTPGTAMGISVSGYLAYIADGSNGVQVVNVSNPASPFFVTSVGVPNVSSGIVVAGRTVFVAHGPQGLRTFNINTNGNLQFLGNVPTPGNANHVAVVGSTAYVADGDLQIIDVTNLNNPFLMASHPTPGDAQGIAVIGTLAVVADGNSGMRMFDVSNPGSPTLVSIYDTPGSSQGVAIAGSRAFMADGDAGLRVLNVLQHQLNLAGNVGQSLALDTTLDNVLYARLTAVAVNTSWQITANGGINWLPATSGGPWMAVTPASDVRWKATLAASPNPPSTAGVSDVTVEWLYVFPVTQSIRDIGHDQGRQVRITWMRSANDFEGASPQIIEYAIYRRIDAGFKPDTPILSASPSTLGAAAAGWDFVTTVPAEAEDEYSVVVPTLGDSTLALGQHWSVFRVRARTATPGVFYDSYPDSGYSLDNLAPGAPNGVVVAYHTNGANAVDWLDATSPDFDYFKVYRSSDPDFIPSPASLAATTVVSSWIDPDYDLPGVFYKVSAVDYAGNESAASAPVATTGIGETPQPARWKLGAAQPNPFRGATSLTMDVPGSSAGVQVRVIGIDGGLVRTLIPGVETPGTRTITWDGRDDFGRNVPAGVYLVRMETAGFLAMRKVLLVR